MTWLDSDKERIRKFLGYPVNAVAMERIQSAMDGMAAVSVGAIGTAQDLLRELVKVEQQLRDSRPYAATTSHSTAGSSTDYYPGMKMQSLREEGRRLALELAQMLELPILGDVFAVPGGMGGRVVR